MSVTTEKHTPLIVAFCCNWCSYAGGDLAGTSRMTYPANVRVIRVPCSGRVSPSLILRAFQRGADGVLIAGCHPGDCHYHSGNFFTRRRFTVLKRTLEFLGIEPERFQVLLAAQYLGLFFLDNIGFSVKISEPFFYFLFLQRYVFS